MVVIFETFGLTKSFGHKDILKDANLKIEDNDKIGLIGANGVGKTTLLGIIAGTIEADAGEIRKKEELRIAYLKQHEEIPGELRVSEYVEGRATNYKIEEELKILEHKLQDTSFYKAEEYKAISARYAELLELKNRTSKSSTYKHLEFLGFNSSNLGKRISELSGGDVRKVMLAKTISESATCDLLLLDEPSNHLDIDSCDYLENVLSNLQIPYIVVSHDRYFLDRTVGKIVELSNCKLKTYSGNYSEYAIKKEEQIRIIEMQNAKDEKERVRLEGIIKEMQSRNRYDPKFKIVARRLDKLKSNQVGVFPTESISFNLSSYKKSGANLLSLVSISKRFDKQIFENANLEISKGEKVGLVGPNGCGKSTLLKMIAGLEKDYEGLIELSYGTRLGYYSQHQENLQPENTVIEEMTSIGVKEDDAKHALAKFLFRGKDILRKVKTLSGGERARLAICKLVSGEHNFLLLDEVTNHLDLDSRHAVELALADYTGSILAASHDRYFLDSFVTRIASIKDKKIFNYNGTFSEFWNAEKRMRSLLEKGELKKFIVRKKYTDWTTGKKYTQGMVLELSELDLGGHKDAVKNGWLVPLKKR